MAVEIERQLDYVPPKVKALGANPGVAI